MVDRHLRLFIQVADSGSFSKAAEKLYISPNAVIKQVNLLESDLGVKLFVRTPRGIHMTKAGELIYREGKSMIARTEAVLKEARALETPPKQSIHVGVSLMNPVNILMEQWNKTAYQHPDIQLEVVPYQDTKAEFSEMLNQLGKTVDIIACPYDTNYWGDRYRSLFLRNLPVCIACSKSHPLAQKERLIIEDLYGETVMVRKQGHSPSADVLRAELQQHPQICLEDVEIIEYGLFNQIAVSEKLMISYECWSNVHPFLATIPVDWNFTSPYGLIYAKNPSKELLKFLTVIGNT